MYDRSGIDNLRGNQTIGHAETPKSPAGRGSPVGGTESLADRPTVLTGPTKRTEGGRDKSPALDFNDRSV